MRPPRTVHKTAGTQPLYSANHAIRKSYESDILENSSRDLCSALFDAFKDLSITIRHAALVVGS